MPATLRRTLLALSCLMAGSLPSEAADTPASASFELRPVTAVIELFTSQGCASCPPADQLLKTYADRKDVLAISLPVDYWDYIGWKDTLASPKNTERQRAYAEGFGIGPVYTPQAVINGAAQVIGSSERQIDQAIADTAAVASKTRNPIVFAVRDNAVIIDANQSIPGAQVTEATIWLAIIQRSSSVTIKTGENSGKTLTYSNVLRSLTPVGVWTGQATVIRLPPPALLATADEHTALVIQEHRTGPILGAAWIGH